MNLQDLKLLLDVAYHERDGQQGFTVGAGFRAASDRLVNYRLLMRNPSQPASTAQVALTTEGHRTVYRFVDRLESSAFIALHAERER